MALENPDKPIDVEIKYENGVRNFALITQPRPEMKDARMIGIAIPNVAHARVPPRSALQDSIASQTFTRTGCRSFDHCL